MAAFKLKIVSLVLLHRTNSGASQHIEPIISSFLGPDSSLPLHKAARFNSKKLLNWIWKSSCASIEERSSGWSLTNFLRSDPHYYQWVFTKSLEEIISCGGDMRLVQWIYEHFPGCEVPKNVVETVARTGYLEFLQFLWDQQDKIKVDWSGEALKKAVEAGHREVSTWLYEHIPYTYGGTELLRLSQAALRTGNVDFAQVLLPPDRNIFLEAGTSWRPEVIEWMLDRGYYTREMEKAAGVAIWKLASQGRLDLIQRIVELYPPPWMDLEQWVFKDWYDAIKMACSGGHLDVVQWLVEHPNGQQAYLRQQSGQQILLELQQQDRANVSAQRAIKCEMIGMLRQFLGYEAFQTRALTRSRILTATTSPSKYLFGRFSANRAARIYCKRLRRLFACLKNTTQLNDMDAKSKRYTSQYDSC
ncbi:hypothetical protein PC113_g19409 [Phytophthora cactorum]|uniref:Ankyrin repeat-containing domain n=1 Tax=Phytophthora cactorum TaxID=29920 RepID=A0A8T0YJN9_9STRA|nr:hypothetical protein PC113_g19409 [Phytophthora cactorum]KAG2909734.1 hypothetical protein PC115_g13172 [Phytophthora cactorum]